MDPGAAQIKDNVETRRHRSALSLKLKIIKNQLHAVARTLQRKPSVKTLRSPL